MMGAIDGVRAFKGHFERWRLQWRAARSKRRWCGSTPSIAQIDLLEARTLLNGSISSFYLVNDTGTSGDNVTSDATLAGTVSGDPELVELDFDSDGLADDWASPDNGSFSFDANLHLIYGQVIVKARAVKWVESEPGMGEWVYSEWVSLTFTYNMVPEITSFTAIGGNNNVWTFEGLVSDENPLAMTITFGGVLEGHQVLVNGDGTFSYSLRLTPDQEGLVTAQTTDEYGEKSNRAEDYIIGGGA